MHTKYALTGSKMGLLKFGWLKNGSTQIWFGSKMGPLKFELAQKWVCSNLVRSKMSAQKWAAQKRLDTVMSSAVHDSPLGTFCQFFTSNPMGVPLLATGHPELGLTP